MNSAQFKEWMRKNPLLHAAWSTELSDWDVAKEMVRYSPVLADRFSNPMIAWMQQGGQADTRAQRQRVGLRAIVGQIAEQVTGKKNDIGTDMQEVMATYTLVDMAMSGIIWEAAKIEAVERLGLTPDSKEYWDHVARLTERVVYDSQPANDRMNTNEMSRNTWGWILNPLQNAAQRVTENMMQPIWRAIHNNSRNNLVAALHGASLWAANLVAASILLGYLPRALWEELKEWLAKWLYEEERYPISEDQRYNFIKDDKWDNTELGQTYMGRLLIQGLGSGMPILNQLSQMGANVYWKLANNEKVTSDDVRIESPILAIYDVADSIITTIYEGADKGLDKFFRLGGISIFGGPSFPLREGNDVLNGKIKEEGEEQVVTD
jgi:hypothetical protein